MAQAQLNAAETNQLIWSGYNSAIRLVSAFKDAEQTIADALGVEKDNTEVQRLLRLPNWFVGSNRRSQSNIQKIVAEVTEKAVPANYDIKRFCKK